MSLDKDEKRRGKTERKKKRNEERGGKIEGMKWGKRRKCFSLVTEKRVWLRWRKVIVKISNKNDGQSLTKKKKKICH